MLGKLLKHEMRATSRYYLLLYVAFIVITLFNKLFLEVSVVRSPVWSVFQGLFMFTYVIMCMAIFVVTAILIISRFYKNLTTDEGYLMFTLPVTVNQHIISKLLVAMLWSVASTIIFIISIFILMSGHGIMDAFHDFGDFWSELISYTGSQVYFSIFIYIVLMLVGAVNSILLVYFAISVGQLMNKHRVLISIAAYFGINFVLQNVISILFLVTGTFEPEFAYMSSYDTSLMISMTMEYFNKIGLISLLITILLNIVYFVMTNLILTKKLNLE